MIVAKNKDKRKEKKAKKSKKDSSAKKAKKRSTRAAKPKTKTAKAKPNGSMTDLVAEMTAAKKTYDASVRAVVSAGKKAEKAAARAAK